MKRVILYTQGMERLGNIHRVMSLCQSLISFFPDVSILLVSGSAMAESFRIPEGIDYIKLPAPERNALDGSTDPLLKLRADILLCTTANFKPDVMMVDTLPFGLQDELKSTLDYLHEHLPKTKVTLILRDILESPNPIQAGWGRQEYAAAIEKYYDEISVLGRPEVFDLPEEYGFPQALKTMTRVRGYVLRESGLTTRIQVRRELGVSEEAPFVLVMAGSGKDGMHIFVNYLQGFAKVPTPKAPRTLMIFGPEMATEARKRLEDWAAQYPQIHTLAVTNDVMSYMDAADVVVTMGGYGTICEILTLNKRAIVVPRLEPEQDQWIRAQRLEQLGHFQVIHPASLTPGVLMRSVQVQLATPKALVTIPPMELDAMPPVGWSLDALYGIELGTKCDR